ncbi:DNA gyrase inhibitor YacG [Alteromonas facilis]|uniref:DNA gyrase inhibitor YacG n=1 Tax=Alteromonas facilis TaxID=2048004 RepID=UPI000C283EEE|nr:DNA gyrase inhibitor YacG [Alteromonas facilis]
MQVNCPTCNKSVTWSTDNEYRPFCCKKCQLIDLGDWATESHVISSPANEATSSLELDEEAIAEAFERQQQDFFKS